MATEKRLIDANALLEKVQFRMEIDNKNAEIIAGCVNIARRLIENAPTVDAVEVVRGQWIPVTERMPEECDRYLCNVRSFAFPGSFYQAILHCDKYGFREGNIYTDDVTHWMPLPEPPETAG